MAQVVSSNMGCCAEACLGSVAALGRAPHYSGSTRVASGGTKNGGFLPKAATRLLGRRMRLESCFFGAFSHFCETSAQLAYYQ
jgi:hypothetical protein